ncbi:EDNRB [Branchiostoma lanceolatum]|uniref:EDNRB protein n=1 Tax=Branchiostoma lanceolatum TaxID=7740 RepID=A0A8K0A392_BRALA|nr:EDNRB [Branchiostoma lanceolatum]CAH1268449.1 EDNRB [Branchiostoma lanceolatum]
MLLQRVSRPHQQTEDHLKTARGSTEVIRGDPVTESFTALPPDQHPSHHSVLLALFNIQNICTLSALQGAHHFGLTLGSFNSCVNPIALYILSRKYKLYMDSLLFCCCSQGGDQVLDPRRGSIWTSRHRPSCDVSSLSVAARLLRRQEAFANESTRSSGLEMGSQAGDSSERNSSVAAE